VSGASRVGAVLALCLLAVPFSFVAGSAFFGLLPLGLAVWLVSSSPWSRRARFAGSAGVVVGTLTLFILVLSQLNFD
jgi:hypothetical protein